MLAEILSSLLLVLLLLILSGVISASEIAFFSLSNETVEKFSKSKSTSKKIVAKLFENPQKLLLTILISNNIVNISISLIGTLLALRLSKSLNTATEILVTANILILTILVLIFGEMIPKLISSKNPEKIATIASRLINLFSVILYPVIELFFIITNFFKKRIPKMASKLHIEDIEPLVELGERYGVIHDEEKEIIKNLLEFPQKTVRDVLTSRVDMVAIEASTNINQIIKIIRETGYSRLPVYQEKIDNIIGILYAKDIISFIRNKSARKKFDIKKFLKEPLFVPETMKLDLLLQEFKKKRMHIAIVVDEFGGTSGLVTLKDVLIEIFGELEKEEEKFKKISDSEFIVDASMTIEELNKILETNLKTTYSDYDTVSGFLLEIMGKIPRENEVVTYENLKFTIQKVDSRRIRKIKIEKIKSE